LKQVLSFSTCLFSRIVRFLSFPSRLLSRNGTSSVCLVFSRIGAGSLVSYLSVQCSVGLEQVLSFPISVQESWNKFFRLLRVIQLDLNRFPTCRSGGLEDDSFLSFDLNMFPTFRSGGLEHDSYLSFDLNMFPTCRSGGLEHDSFLSFDMNMFPTCRSFGMEKYSLPVCSDRLEQVFSFLQLSLVYRDLLPEYKLQFLKNSHLISSQI
jgi:hypothetical protein